MRFLTLIIWIVFLFVDHNIIWSKSNYIQIKVDFQVKDSKGIDHELGPGYYYSDKEFQQFQLDQLEASREANILKLKNEYLSDKIEALERYKVDMSDVREERNAINARLLQIKEQQITIWEQRVDLEIREAQVYKKEVRVQRRRNKMLRLRGWSLLLLGLKLGSGAGI